jgi:hypothetical protein
MAAVVAPWLQPKRAVKSINASKNKWRKRKLFIQKGLVEILKVREMETKVMLGKAALDYGNFTIH